MDQVWREQQSSYCTDREDVALYERVWRSLESFGESQGFLVTKVGHCRAKVDRGTPLIYSEGLYQR